MPKFVIGQPITTREPAVEVEQSIGTALAPGSHRFQLIVVDDAGQESEPAVVEVIVVDDAKPTAVADGPGRVPMGSSFRLSGARSSDIAPGKIVTYRWVQLS